MECGLALSAVLLYAGANTNETVTAVTLMSLALGCSRVSDVTFWAATIDVPGEEVGAACGILNAGKRRGPPSALRLPRLPLGEQV